MQDCWTGLELNGEGEGVVMSLGGRGSRGCGCGCGEVDGNAVDRW